MANILIIDDSEYQLDVVKDFLEKQGFTIRILSLHEVIHHHIHDYKPDIILLDVIRGKSSRDICTELKTSNVLKNIPVILMSTDYNKLENYEECFADGVIKKPFIIGEVIAKINSVLEVYSLRS